ncbi:MAG TPA: hypothetical protein VNE62_04085 [Actinomycetota bacterium]|nr:hypothetical protein [Actinomycetota bacterium]
MLLLENVLWILSPEASTSQLLKTTSLVSRDRFSHPTATLRLVATILTRWATQAGEVVSYRVMGGSSSGGAA